MRTVSTLEEERCPKVVVPSFSERGRFDYESRSEFHRALFPGLPRKRPFGGSRGKKFVTERILRLEILRLIFKVSYMKL